MQFINALSFAPDVNVWLTNSHHPRILHVFDHACNLINERSEVLSIVTPRIGNGPFNLVIEDDILFSNYLSVQSQVSNSPSNLNLGSFIIHTTDAKLWSPRPDWDMLHSRMSNILNQIMSLPIPNCHLSPIHLQFSNSLLSSIATADLQSSKTSASKLAGLGIGLTPSGDDFILGAILAARIIHAPEIANVLAEEVTNTAAPLTTSLSSAYLKSAGKGDAGILWHDFFDALIAGDTSNIKLQIAKLLSIGETSGADTLAGFFGICIAFNERIIDECPS